MGRDARTLRLHAGLAGQGLRRACGRAGGREAVAPNPATLWAQPAPARLTVSRCSRRAPPPTGWRTGFLPASTRALLGGIEVTRVPAGGLQRRLPDKTPRPRALPNESPREHACRRSLTPAWRHGRARRSRAVIRVRRLQRALRSPSWLCFDLASRLSKRDFELGVGRASGNSLLRREKFKWVPNGRGEQMGYSGRIACSSARWCGTGPYPAASQRRRASMAHFAGLDVSVAETSICIVDEHGKIVRERKVPTEPEEIIAALNGAGQSCERIGLEAGPLSQWLYGELAEAGLPVICIETRHIRAVLEAQVNKTDRNDARGIAQMMRVGLFRPVHVKTLQSQQRRMLLTTRKLLQSKMLDLENDLRGTLKNFGFKVGKIGAGSTPRAVQGAARAAAPAGQA